MHRPSPRSRWRETSCRTQRRRRTRAPPSRRAQVVWGRPFRRLRSRQRVSAIRVGGSSGRRPGTLEKWPKFRIGLPMTGWNPDPPTRRGDMTDLPFGLSADPFALPATLTAEQTARLIDNRVRACGGDAAALFPPDTCAEIHRHAHGVTGAVCDLAGKAMRLAAAAGAPSVSPEHVRAAAGP